MLMSYVLEAHLKHNFAKIVARTAGLSAQDDEALYGKGASKVDAAAVPMQDTAAFGVRTAALLRTAASVMWVKLAEDEALLSIYRDMELPVSCSSPTRATSSTATPLGKLLVRDLVWID